MKYNSLPAVKITIHHTLVTVDFVAEKAFSCRAFDSRCRECSFFPNVESLHRLFGVYPFVKLCAPCSEFQTRYCRTKITEEDNDVNTIFAMGMMRFGVSEIIMAGIHFQWRLLTFGKTSFFLVIFTKLINPS